MSYDVRFSQTAEKQLKKLPRSIQEHIIRSLERARIRPHAHFVRLVGTEAYRLRVGKYRVIADIDDGDLIVFVIEMGKRDKIYD